MTVCANFELGKGQIEAVEAVGKLYHEHGVKNINPVSDTHLDVYKRQGIA